MGSSNSACGMSKPCAAALALCLLLAACSSTKVDFSGKAPAAPLCQLPGENVSALVLWAPAWRPDQKDVAAREEAARRGLEEFLASSGCFARFEARRLAVASSDEQLLSLAQAASPKPDRVIALTVRELGPLVKLLGSAALVEGGTEVVLGIRAIDARSGAPLGNFQTHWQNGGAMVIKGVDSLPRDMSAALSAALSPASQSERTR
jgi:hypothetical protein